MKGIIPLVIAVVAIMGFRLRRVMRDQPYRSATVWTRVVLLCILAVVFFVVEMRTRIALAGVAGGFLAGLVLGGLSLRQTHFDFSSDAPSYRTNPYIGSVVVALFAIRILYDALQQRAKSGHAVGAINPLAVSWPSALLYFLFVSYWGVYYVGLIRAFQRRR